MNAEPFLRRLASLVIFASLLALGCAPEAGETEPGPKGAAETPGALPEELTDVAMARLKRIREADPLAVGRVVTLFDFEEPAQVESFEKLGEDSYDVRHISTAKAATGLSSLQVRLTAARPRLAAVRGVPADWREYRLLRMEVCAERHVPRFFLRLRDAGGRGADYGAFRLRPGWQAVTIELDRLAGLVDLGRIARLTVAVAEPDRDVSFWLDDLVLIDNRAVRWPVYGNQRTVGYRVSGRTLTVFGPAGFEVAFAPDDDGVYRLSRWVVLERRRRLIRSAPRAPLLAIDPKLDLSRLGLYRQNDCRVVEMNRVRVRVRLRRLFFDEFEQVAAGTAHRIEEIYTIYGSGQIYVTHEVSAGDEKVESLSLRLRTSEVLRPLEPAGGAEAAGGSALWTAHADQRRGREAAVLLALAPGVGKGTVRRNRWPGRLSLSQIDLPPAPTAKLAARLPLMLNVNPGSADAIADALTDYARPLEMLFTRGRRSFTDPGDGDQNGFNEAEGCHVIRADEGVVRFTLRPRRGARQSPVFKIVNLDAANFLVNVGGRVTEVIARDAGGDAIAQIPGRLDRSVSVEITPATGTRHPILPEVW